MDVRGLTRRPGEEAAGGHERALDALHLAVMAGAPLGPLEDLPPRAYRAVTLAQEVGAPLVGTIEATRAAADDVRQAQRAVEVASAQTRVVAAGLLLAPLILVPGLARLAGADLIGFYTSGLGALVLAVGLGLLGAGALLVVLLVRRVGRREDPTRPAASRRSLPVAVVAATLVGATFGWVLAPPAGLLTLHLLRRRDAAPGPAPGVDEAADLVATALDAGVNAAEALRLAADRLPAHASRLRRLAFGLELGMGADDLAPPAGRRQGHRVTGDPIARLAVLLETADRTGAPVADSVRHLAAGCRADDLARVLAAAERLPAQLTFPTALCLLPATVLLIGAPIVQTGFEVVGR